MANDKNGLNAKTKTWGSKTLIALLALNIVIVVGCGGTDENASKTANGANRSTNSIGQGPRDGNASVPQVPPPGNVDPNAPSSENRVAQKLEDLKATAANSSSKGPVKVTPRPAAEDSEIVMQLTDVARETRTFRSHPTILKIEKTSDGQQSVVFVHLRDGRKIEIPAASVPNLSAITSAEILNLIGAPQKAPVRQRDANRVKKEGM